MAARNPSLRKDKRELLKGMQRETTDPNDLVQSDDKAGPRSPNLERNPGWTKQDTYQNPPSLPLSIKVSKSSNSQVTSSVVGLSSLMDMSMTEISEENQISMVKGCIKQHVFSTWKFYQRDFHGSFSEDQKTMCGFIMKHTNIQGTENWWLGMRRIVDKTHTDLCNNAIKDMQTKFKGKEMKLHCLALASILTMELFDIHPIPFFRRIQHPIRSISTQTIQWMWWWNCIPPWDEG